ncbi:hypothetical protein QJS04_geneDACA020445 [Acorus gramineus]|uniref:Uncharacterized protein n=1 Tax=Acorus gramineus TaxID=55184 RepID=A0AAV9BUY5_ACOGR|nr:hypothetical protein QJS04_geneDACA020445 [Acorus gramineus]
MRLRFLWSLFEWFVGVTNALVEMAVQATGSLEQDHLQPDQPVLILSYLEDLQRNRGKCIFKKMLMDEEELHRCLQKDTPASTSDKLNGTPAAKVVMNDKASASLIRSETMPRNQKPFLVLVSLEYLERRTHMILKAQEVKVNGKDKLNNDHVSINMESLIRRMQRDTTTTLGSNLNRALEVEGNNSIPAQQEDSRQSENDKEVAESGWRIYLAIFPLSLGMIVTLLSTQDHPPKTCILLLFLSAISNTILLVVLIIKGPALLVKIFKGITLVMVVTAVGLLAYALLPEHIYTVTFVIPAVIMGILFPVTLICIGMLRGSSQQFETDKEAIESGWKICLMNFVGSSGLILTIYHMQDHPTKACIALIIVAFILSANGLALLCIREQDRTIHTGGFIVLVNLYVFTPSILVVIAVGFLVYSLLPVFMFTVLVVLAVVTIVISSPLGFMFIRRNDGDSLQTDDEVVQSGWSISLMVPLVSLGGIIGMFNMQNLPPEACFFSLVVAFISSTSLSALLMTRGQAQNYNVRRFLLLINSAKFISVVSMLVPLVYLAVNALEKYVRTSGST